MEHARGMEGRCLILQPIHLAGIEALRRAGLTMRTASSLDHEALREEIRDCRAVLTRNAAITRPMIETAPALEVIGVHGIGVDPIAVDFAAERGIPVVNTPYANVRSVAEQAIALTLHLAKAIGPADRAARAGDFDFKYRARLVEIEGLTFGVIGLGNIGRATARLAKAVGFRVGAYSRGKPDEVFAAEGIERFASVDALLQASDVVSLHLPARPGAPPLIGARELRLMKPTAFLINTARGALVDEAALAEALAAGHIAGAGLDVFAREPLLPDSPLCRLDNVVLTPHTAGSTGAALKRTAIQLAEQVLAVLSGRRPDHLVDPQAWPRFVERRARGEAKC
ncbi:hydroxyacid dehydrogenase [Rhodoligotrophos defluvii]|uniref:hydroxyacid dehydrogenase n=1 Tax=Rhodoligotrophos defluvii TaxID=2561934 RepID=UPI001EF11064|nr:hydroxyacid dehydrogenase [Rhodoligotrophos defluvii]